MFSRALLAILVKVDGSRDVFVVSKGGEPRRRGHRNLALFHSEVCVSAVGDDVKLTRPRAVTIALFPKILPYIYQASGY